MNPTIGRDIATLARSQQGYVVTEQLLALGLTPPAINRMCTEGWLHRDRHGVYAVGFRPPGRHGDWSAATLAVGLDAALSGIAAAQLRGYTRRRTTRIDITAPRQRRLIPGAHVHRSRLLEHAAASEVFDGVRTLVPSLLIVDLGAYMRVEELVNVMHEAQFLGQLDIEAVDWWVRKAGRRHGVPRVRDALASYLGGAGGTETRLEARVLAVIRQMGLPEPQLNPELPALGRTRRPDMLWRTLGVALEIDGDAAHKGPVSVRRDRVRDAVFRGRDITLIRLREVDFERDPVGSLLPLVEVLSAAEEAQSKTTTGVTKLAPCATNVTLDSAGADGQHRS